MKHTKTSTTATGPVTVEATTTYKTPRKGDSLFIYGTKIVLAEDMMLAVEFSYNEELKKYEGSPKKTIEGTPRLVFYGSGYSWRFGEYFESCTK